MTTVSTPSASTASAGSSARCSPGVFADVAINEGGKGHNVLTQLLGIGWTAGYCAVMTLIILFALKFTIGLTVKPEQEEEGLDYSLHGESVH